MEEERRKLAESIFNGDKVKAEALLQLIDMSTRFNSRMPDVKMCLPEEDCLNCASDGTCLLNFPDSAFKCNGKCENVTYLAEKLNL